jgi:hypothetical protein
LGHPKFRMAFDEPRPSQRANNSSLLSRRRHQTARGEASTSMGVMPARGPVGPGCCRGTGGGRPPCTFQGDPIGSGNRLIWSGQPAGSNPLPPVRPSRRRCRASAVAGTSPPGSGSRRCSARPGASSASAGHRRWDSGAPKTISPRLQPPPVAITQYRATVGRQASEACRGLRRGPSRDPTPDRQPAEHDRSHWTINLTLSRTTPRDITLARARPAAASVAACRSPR